MEMQDRVEEGKIDLFELFKILTKRRSFILKICAISSLVSIVYTLTLPNIYSATARVLPPQKEGGSGLSALLSQSGGIAAGLVGGSFGGGSELYVGILKSRSIADTIVRRLDLAKVYQVEDTEDARKKLEAAVKFQAGKEGIIAITANDRDPKRAAIIANLFVEELSKTTIRLSLSKASTERVFLEQRLSLVKADLKRAEDELRSFAQINKIAQVDSQAKASIESIARLKGELANKEVQLSMLTSKQTENSPEVKALRSGIRRLSVELQGLTNITSDENAIPSIGNLPAVGLEYTRKLRNLKVQEAIFEQLTKQYEAAKLNEAKDSSMLQTLDEAVVPIQKSDPKRSIIVAITAVIAFLASIIFVLLQDIFIKKFSKS